jgi:predicted transcriptional regulator
MAKVINLSVRLEPELKAALDEAAAVERRSAGAFVRNLIEDQIMRVNPQHAHVFYEGRDTAGARKLARLRYAADHSAHGSKAIADYGEAHDAACADVEAFERQAEADEKAGG